MITIHIMVYVYCVYLLVCLILWGREFDGFRAGSGQAGVVAEVPQLPLVKPMKIGAPDPN